MGLGALGVDGVEQADLETRGLRGFLYLRCGLSQTAKVVTLLLLGDSELTEKHVEQRDDDDSAAHT